MNHSGGLRIWSDATGQYQLEARLISVQDDMVRLCNAQGKYFRIALDQLSRGRSAVCPQPDPGGSHGLVGQRILAAGGQCHQAAKRRRGPGAGDIPPGPRFFSSLFQSGQGGQSHFCRDHAPRGARPKNWDSPHWPLAISPAFRYPASYEPEQP